MEKSIADCGEDSGNGAIKPGYIFADEDSWEPLKPGCGVVIAMSDGNTTADSETWNITREQWRKHLLKALAAAKERYGEANVFLVWRSSRRGDLVWRPKRGKNRPATKKWLSVVPRLRRQNFSQRLEAGARRG